MDCMPLDNTCMNQAMFSSFYEKVYGKIIPTQMELKDKSGRRVVFVEMEGEFVMVIIDKCEGVHNCGTF